LLVKHGTKTVQAMVGSLVSRLDEQQLRAVPEPESLELNDIGQITLRTSEPLPVDDYTTSPRTGAFLVIDPKDGDTLAAGMAGTGLGVLGGNGSAG
jgi:sulfate adenylyltransferase subunit 1